MNREDFDELVKQLESEGIRVNIIEAQENQQCDLCGKIAELRPYGRNGQVICFECGMKDEETTKNMFYKYNP